MPTISERQVRRERQEELVARLFSPQLINLRLVESGLPVEKFFAPRRDEESFVGHAPTGRRQRVLPYFSRHRAAAVRLTLSGRNFIRAFADLTGGALAELQIIRRTSQRQALISLAPHLGEPRKSTFLLVGPGDQGGLLVQGTGSVNLRAGDLWHAETGLGNFQVETIPGVSELLLLRLES